MSATDSWAALLERLAARYAEAGTPGDLAALRCRAVAGVAEHLAPLTPEQVGPEDLLAALEVLRLDTYRWHLHRLALADALPAGAGLPTHRPPHPTTARHPR